MRCSYFQCLRHPPSIKRYLCLGYICVLFILPTLFSRLYQKRTDTRSQSPGPDENIRIGNVTISERILSPYKRTNQSISERMLSPYKRTNRSISERILSSYKTSNRSVSEMILSPYRRTKLSISERIPSAYKSSNRSGVRKRPPSAFILGAGKCGTGALRWFLRLHPQIVMPIKEELWFYDLHFKSGEVWHLNQMPSSRSDQITMETSPGYFHHQAAMQRIVTAEYNHDARFVVILRDPIDRALSHFIHKLVGPSKGERKIPQEKIRQGFERAAVTRSGSVLRIWEPISYGVYAPVLKRWLGLIPLSRIFVVDGTAFAKNPLPQLKKLEHFLGVQPFFDESHFVYNKTKGFYCLQSMNGSTACLPKSKGREHPQLNTYVVNKLKRFYKPHNEELFKLLGKRFEWQ